MKFPRPSLLLIAIAACCWGSALSYADEAGYKNITFDDIKLELEKDEKYIPEKHLNEKVDKLQGQKIRIRGWIHPSVFTQTGITQFVLVRDNQECCFGPGRVARLHLDRNGIWQVHQLHHASHRGGRRLQGRRDSRWSQRPTVGHLWHEGGQRQVDRMPA